MGLGRYSLGNLGAETAPAAPFNWGGLLNTLVGGAVQIQTTEAQADSQRKILEAQTAADIARANALRAAQSAPAAGMSMDTAMKIAIPLGIGGVLLLVVALIMKKRRK